MRAQLIGWTALALTLAACGATDGTTDADTDTDTTGETDTETDVETDTEDETDSDEESDTEIAEDLGTEVFTESFEDPILDPNDYTASGGSWSLDLDPGAWPAVASGGVYHVTLGLDDVTPLAAPGAGNNALYQNTSQGYSLRLSREVVTMTAGTTYTLKGAVAERTDVGLPATLVVAFGNGSSPDQVVASEAQLGALLDDDLVAGAFQSFTATFVADADDEGDPLLVRFSALSSESSVRQVLWDNLTVYAK